MANEGDRKLVAVVDDDSVVLDSLQDNFSIHGKKQGEEFLLIDGSDAEKAITRLNAACSNITFLVIDSLGGEFAKVAEAAIKKGIDPDNVFLWTNDLKSFENTAREIGIKSISKRAALTPFKIPEIATATS